MLRFSGAGVSDVGRRRPHNEDSAFVGPYVAVVADGVGGAAAGEVASATTAYAVAATALARAGAPAADVVREACQIAVQSLRAGVGDDASRDGMATTMTCVIASEERVVLGHVGDSRAYLLSHDGGALQRISRDHTYVQLLVDEWELDAERARTHPWRNVVLRSLDGSGETAVPDVVAIDVAVGDRLLLCSDGLTDLVDEARIAEVLTLRHPQAAAAVLVQAALIAGGTDNVTCLVLDVVDGPMVVGDGRLLGAVADPANVVDPAAVHLV